MVSEFVCIFVWGHLYLWKDVYYKHRQKAAYLGSEKLNILQIQYEICEIEIVICVIFDGQMLMFELQLPLDFEVIMPVSVFL